MNSVLVSILQGGQLVGLLANIGVDLALKIKQLFAPLGPDVQVNITSLGDQAVAADQDTIAMVNAWLTANGYPVLQLPEPVTGGPKLGSGGVRTASNSPEPAD